MNGNPKAAQKEWHKWLRERGCVINRKPPDIHHIGGSKMKLKGFNDQKPGEWYVIPLSPWWHRFPANPKAVHSNRKEFEKYTKKTEKQFFQMVVAEYEAEFGEKPMPEDLFNALIERA